MQQQSPPTSRSPQTAIIRRATDADAVPLQRYVASIFAERLPVLYRRDQSPSVADELAFIRQISQTPRSLILVAVAGDEIVGMLDFHGHQKPQRSHAGEFGMSVAKTQRGTGIASQLIGHLIHWASAERLRRLELSVFSNNTRAISFYNRQGFEREGTQRQAVEVDGAYVDILLMAKTLRNRSVWGRGCVRETASIVEVGAARENPGIRIPGLE